MNSIAERKNQQQREKSPKTRNSSIELLRILAAIFVIIWHSVIGYAVYGPKVEYNYFFIYFICSIAICAVNVFVMVSAYFLSTTNKRKISKVFELLFFLILLRLTRYFFIDVIINHNTISLSRVFYLSLPVNYFLTLYVALYFISPFINRMLDNLSKKMFQKLIIVSSLFFLCFTTSCDILDEVLFSKK